MNVDKKVILILILNVNNVVTPLTHVTNALAQWMHPLTLAAQTRLYFPQIIDAPSVLESKDTIKF